MQTPSPTPPGFPANDQDDEHLRLLMIFHYIMAALTALFSLIPFIHVGLGFMMLFHPETFAKGQPPPPAFVGALFLGLGLFAIALGWAVAFCTFLSGRYIRARKRRVFSLVIAGLLCLAVPLGTLLGVFTLLILNRESVQQLYRMNENRS